MTRRGLLPGGALALMISASTATAEPQVPPHLHDRMVCAVELSRYSAEFRPGHQQDYDRANEMFAEMGAELGFTDIWDREYHDMQVPYADNPPFADMLGPEAMAFLEECRERYPAAALSGDAGGWQDMARADAAAFHAASLPEGCEKPVGAPPAGHELQIGEESAARQALLIGFPCQSGAYNRTEVFLMADQHGTITEVLFPSPQVEVVWPGGDQSQKPVSVSLGETPDLREVVNPVYDPASRLMVERNKWRGQNDAYTLTEWGYKDGRFQLVHFAVDAVFDGEDRPETLIRNEIW